MRDPAPTAAVQLADLIGHLLHRELPGSIVTAAEPDGPLFAKIRLRGSEDRFAIIVEELAR